MEAEVRGGWGGWRRGGRWVGAAAGAGRVLGRDRGGCRAAGSTWMPRFARGRAGVGRCAREDFEPSCQACGPTALFRKHVGQCGFEPGHWMSGSQTCTCLG